MLSGLAKFILGVLAGVTLLAAAGGATAYYFLTRLSVLPQKPIFAEELPKSKPLLKGKNSSDVKGKKKSSDKSNSTPTKGATPSPTPETPSETGLYKGRISWREGVSLREEATRSSNRVGGIEYNKPIIVLEESEDKKWVLVREENGIQKGWVRTPNIERTNPDEAQENNTDSEQQQ